MSASNSQTVAVPREVVEFFVRWHSPGHMEMSPNPRDMLPRLKEALEQSSGPEERSTVAPNVDGQNFYELCQQYRWAKEMMPHGLPNVVQAFDNLREYIKTGKLPWPSFEGDAPDAHP